MKNMVKGQRWIILAVMCLVTVIASAVIVTGNNNNLAAQSPVQPPGHQMRPFKYVLELDGTTIGAFDTASLDVARGVVEYRDGTDLIVVKKLPQNSVECGYIVLGSKPSNPALDAIWARFQNSVTVEDDWEAPVPANGWLIVVDPEGVEVERYQLTNAWPCKWTVVGNLDGKGTDNIVELAVDIIIRR